ncbi:MULTISPECIES: mercury(II) reductase [Pyrobaculum]|uniref:Mercuric reductase n=4 Tax=Pyrobaculum TaxID=2276 RepID=A4WK56_PYRAR|nr:mercury(II) reductase [Pyrobaculum arsenaticum]ABP50773.1 mercuric reductase [Pyrobaculum arsenaticum DSM 13514]NYR15510.1 mercury(II) reductase [Pyrobaculum arsenaticum]
MYDLVVLGGGSAGFAAAIKASELGARVVIVNAGLPPGGTCVNVGCVPTKFLVKAAEALRWAQAYFPEANLKPSLRRLLAEAAETSAMLRKEKYVDLLDYYGIEYIEGRGVLAGPGRVMVEGRGVLEGKRVVVATGSRPAVPNIKGLGEVGYYTNQRLFDLGEPSSVVFVGGGAVAVELAQALNRLGVKTAIVARGRLLKYEEEMASQFVEEVLKEEGVEVVRDEAVAVRRADGGVEVETRAGRRLRAEALFVAAGRVPNSEVAGGLLELNSDGSIRVNKRLETSMPGVYAAGDVAGGVWLRGGRYAENAAARQGTIAAVNALGGHEEYDPAAVPRVVFTDPPVASVGVSEDEMITSGIGCRCAAVPIDVVAAAWASKRTSGFIKINTYPETWRVSMKGGKIAGAVVAAPHAEELIHVFAIAVKLGLRIGDLAELVPAFPSFGEALRVAALAFEKDVSKLSCCAG